ncbi:MAG TPA: cation:dicarboxylase symporter family transporter [Dongiaceae bacterium]|nr:cation:dicarboxylase symporter family transporter [Dongiaceae bacterium]
MNLLKRISSLSLSTHVIIALLSGIATGLFFGDRVAFLDTVGIAFIKLLQMTVIPYIATSLMLGIGSMSSEQAKGIAAKVGLLTLVMWLLGFAVIFLTPFTFPRLETASFFSDTTLLPQKEVDYLDLYIPSNPFKSLSDTAVPAVVLFFAAVGVALIGTKDKEHLLAPLETFSAALSRATKAVMRLIPIGVFAICAATAGTMSPEQFDRLGIFFAAYIVAALLLTFWILPLFLTTFTPFRYRDVVGLSRNALVTAFVTGNLFLVLPLLTEGAKELCQKYFPDRAETEDFAESIIPISFNFPSLGKLSTLIFILFAGWFTGRPVPVQDYPLLALNGLMNFFGSANLAVPALLDSIRVPTDLFQLFIVARLVTDKFSSLLSAMGLLVLTLGSITLLTRNSRLRGREFAVFGAVSLAVVLLAVGATRVVLARTFHPEYTLGKALMEMQVADAPPILPPPPERGNVDPGGPPTISTIVKRGVLKVGYNPDQVPFSYYNSRQELVGFDVALIGRLAHNLNVPVEFIPYDPDQLAADLSGSRFDVAISALQLSPDRLVSLTFTEPVLELTMALVVKGYRREEFSSPERIHQAGRLVIATVGDYTAMDKIRKNYPNVDFVRIDSDRQFFAGKERFDGLLISLEAGMAWTVLHPDYKAVFFKTHINKFPVAYAVAYNNLELQVFLNSWLNVQKSAGTVQALYDKWILGKGAENHSPRWSVVKDVLHWVKE